MNRAFLRLKNLSVIVKLPSKSDSIIETNYEIILREEENFSRAVASKVIDKPVVSAWMIFFPFILIQYFFNLRRFKSGVEIFAREFLQNKKIALDSAKESLLFGTSKELAVERHFSFLNASENSEKTKTLRQKQLNEIDILFDHYEKLLKTPGETLYLIIKRAYLTEFSYRQFINKLQRAEKETYEEIINLYGANKEYVNVVSRIESVVEKLREEEIRRIFYLPSLPSNS